MNSGVTVKTKKIKRALTYKDKTVLQYDIAYPKFYSGERQQPCKVINNFFFKQANELANHCERTLVCEAIREYKQREKDCTPFAPYEVTVEYTVTYSGDCAVSLYMQKYAYMGGAHGSTTQYAYSYTLRNEREITLKQLYPQCGYREEDIKEGIKCAIKRQIARGKGMYFDDYAELIDKTFRTDNFYLGKKGVHFFFNQYEIAPYVAGIPTFILPYSFEGPFAPTVL